MTSIESIPSKVLEQRLVDFESLVIAIESSPVITTTTGHNAHFIDTLLSRNKRTIIRAEEIV